MTANGSVNKNWQSTNWNTIADSESVFVSLLLLQQQQQLSTLKGKRRQFNSCLLMCIFHKYNKNSIMANSFDETVDIIFHLLLNIEVFYATWSFINDLLNVPNKLLWKSSFWWKKRAISCNSFHFNASILFNINYEPLQIHSSVNFFSDW